MKNSSIALIAIALIAMMFFEQIAKAFGTQLSLQIFDFLKNLLLEFLQQTSLKNSSIALLVAMMFFEQIA